MTWDAFIAFLDAITHGWWAVFPAAALIGVLLLAHSWIWSRLYGPPVSRLADPGHDPELDRRTEAELRAELDAEAARHDLDGLAINWDEEMKRRRL